MLSVYGFNVKGNAASKFGVFRALKVPDAASVKPGDTDPESGLVFPDVADLGDYTVQSMGARVAKSVLGVATTSTNYLLLRSKTDGKYYLLSFDYKMNSESSIVFTLDGFRPFPETEGFGEKSLFEVQIGGNEYIFYTAGSNNEKLYVYNILDGTSVCVYTAGARITSLCPGVVAIPNTIVKTVYMERMLLGTEAGGLALLDISADVVESGSLPEIGTFSGLGKVVDMDFYKAQHQGTYFGF